MTFRNNLHVTVYIFRWRIFFCVSLLYQYIRCTWINYTVACNARNSVAYNTTRRRLFCFPVLIKVFCLTTTFRRQILFTGVTLLHTSVEPGRLVAIITCVAVLQGCKAVSGDAAVFMLTVVGQCWEVKMNWGILVCRTMGSKQAILTLLFTEPLTQYCRTVLWGRSLVQHVVLLYAV